MPHWPRPSNISRASSLEKPNKTGNTFTIRFIQPILKLLEQKVIAVVTSVVAASLFDGWRTVHPAFKIRIPFISDLVYNLSTDSRLASNIRQGSLIIQDEIVMCVIHCAEATNRALWAITKSLSVPLGGSYVLFGSDFRQVLPTIPRGLRGTIVFVTLKYSLLFFVIYACSN